MCDLLRVVSVVEERATATALASKIHGARHWRDVARIGARLCRHVAADADVVFLFALIHDSQRHSDGRDRDHGRRAAAFAQQLREEGVIDLPGLAADLLSTALSGHADGTTSTDPTIGACWDADRLTLSRIGRTPRREFLSTKVAPSLVDEGRAVVAGPGQSWEGIVRRPA